MDLHIGYESVPAFPVKRVDNIDDKARKAGLAPKAILKADMATGRIILDSETTLSGVPTAAWDYMLGNRSALEWILDQYKEKKPKDPTIRKGSTRTGSLTTKKRSWTCSCASRR